MIGPTRVSGRPTAPALLAGKRLLVTGVVTTDSIAFASAAAAIKNGAEIVLSTLGRDREQAEATASQLPAPVEVLATDFDAITRAFHASTHSYASLAQLVSDLAPIEGGAIVGLDFDARGAWPVYNWMGVCKAGLAGEVVHVDGGYHAMAAPLRGADDVSVDAAPVRSPG